ncbi:DUF2799 domain-containing protein [Jannaschia formosa]|uniref:DUF2799 domain-containing protein n=1 Tax=Jannaschia formosa TaxID=2259592 RepID=UPI001430C599|nr:DUF2799 domain-containing protein [Jannaschia formosa]
MRLLFALCLMAGLGGCAELTEFSCAQTDAQALGERLARRGQPEAALAQEAARCAATPTPLRSDLLAAGHARGRAIHCTPEGAFEAGHGGHRLGAFCPAEARPALQAAHRRGVLLGEIESEIRSLRNERFHLVAELQSLAKEDPRRGVLRHRLWQLDRRLDRLDSRRFLLRAGAF